MVLVKNDGTDHPESKYLWVHPKTGTKMTTSEKQLRNKHFLSAWQLHPDFSPPIPFLSQIPKPSYQWLPIKDLPPPSPVEYQPAPPPRALRKSQSNEDISGLASSSPAPKPKQLSLPGSVFGTSYEYNGDDPDIESVLEVPTKKERVSIYEPTKQEIDDLLRMTGHDEVEVKTNADDNDDDSTIPQAPASLEDLDDDAVDYSVLQQSGNESVIPLDPANVGDIDEEESKASDPFPSKPDYPNPIPFSFPSKDKDKPSLLGKQNIGASGLKLSTKVMPLWDWPKAEFGHQIYRKQVPVSGMYGVHQQHVVSRNKKVRIY